MMSSLLISESLNQHISQNIYLQLLQNYPLALTETLEKFKVRVYMHDNGEEKVIYPTETEFYSHLNLVILFFIATCDGDITKIYQYIDNVKDRSAYCDWPFSFLSNIEVAFDLATRFQHHDIAKFLMHHITLERQKYHLYYAELMSSFMELPKLYKLKSFTVNQNLFLSSIDMQLFKNNKIKIDIYYHSAYQYPFIEEIEINLGGETQPNHCVRFTYDCILQNEKEIRYQTSKLWDALNKLQDGNFEELQTVIDVFFDDIKNNFPASEPISNNICHRTSNFIDFLMHEAIFNGDEEKIMALLKLGANPNSYFANKSILRHALYPPAESVDDFILPMLLDKSGMIVERRKKLLRLTRAIEYLFEYGVDPFFQGEHLLQDMINTNEWESHFAEQMRKESPSLYDFHDDEHDHLVQNFYQNIIRLLPATEKSWQWMKIHPQYAQSTLGLAILDTNLRMQKYISRKTKNYVAPLEHDHNTKNGSFSFLLKDGPKISIETHEISTLNEQQREMLAHFFATQSSVSVKGKSKKSYFKDELNKHAGVTFVDVIKLNNEIAGIYVYEYINAKLNNKSTFIHYIKLVAARLEDYPELIKFIILMRSFVCRTPTYNSISFAEIASEFGFSLGANLKRYPTHQLSEINMEELGNLVKGVEPVKLDNGYYYLPDGMTVANDANRSQPSSALITLSLLSRKTFNANYYRSGHALCVAFLNDNENFQRFKKTVLPIFGQEIFCKLFSHYAKPVNEFLSTSGIPSMPIRPKL